MTPEGQIKLGKAMQLVAIFVLLGVVTAIFGFAADPELTNHQMLPLLLPLGIIYGSGLTTLGNNQVRKGRKRIEQRNKIIAEAEEKAAAELGPEVCRTGGDHVFLGTEDACVNGCGTTRRQLEAS